MRTAIERVNRGAGLLDEYRPGWYRAIDCGALDIGTGSHCVLGQLFGSYGTGLNKLGIGGDAGTYGFCSGGVATIEELNETWREEIARKRLIEMPVSVPDEVGVEAFC